MTRPSKKIRERTLVEEAAKHLGKVWVLSADREHPDFLVTEGKQQFGLEVCEIFKGPQGRGGSALKEAESHIQRKLNLLRREYEEIAAIPLSVKAVGVLSTENLALVVPALVALDFASKETGYRDVVDTGTGLRIHVTKALRGDWITTNDRAGFVDRNPMSKITDAIREKSEELARYHEAAGPDIRLLLVADHIRNSGKLMLEGAGQVDTRGFRAVYFFSFPESVTVLEAATSAQSSDSPQGDGVVPTSS